jgi:4-hydroxy-tetrahydrodipicolinate reductase
MAREVRVVQCGLGPIGLEMARRVLETDGLKLVGVSDIAPDKAGQDLGTLLGRPRKLRLKVEPDLAKLLRAARADVGLLTTSSSVRECRPQIAAMLAKRLNVVSTCEELAFPARAHAAAAREIDRLARQKKVSVLGTGVNPGFAMDVLALTLTAPCTRVERVAVTRVVDAGTRRIPLQRKVGAGLDIHLFRRATTEGTVGHVGLLESAHMIADGLGLKLDRFEPSLEPVMASRDLDTPYMRIPAGGVAGIKQFVRGYRGKELILSLDLQMYVAAEKPRDHVLVEGEPRIDMTIEGGIAGEAATVAMALNSIPKLIAAAPGLRTMRDLSLVHALNTSELRSLAGR